MVFLPRHLLRRAAGHVPDVANVVTAKQVARVADHSMQSVGGAAQGGICSMGPLLPACHGVMLHVCYGVDHCSQAIDVIHGSRL